MVVLGICYFDEVLCKGDVVIFYFIVLGYEGVGIVEKVGFEVKDFKFGDYVIFFFYGCGNCVNCMKGMLIKCFYYVVNNLLGVCLDGSVYFIENGYDVVDMFD